MSKSVWSLQLALDLATRDEPVTGTPSFQNSSRMCCNLSRIGHDGEERWGGAPSDSAEFARNCVAENVFCDGLMTARRLMSRPSRGRLLEERRTLTEGLSRADICVSVLRYHQFHALALLIYVDLPTAGTSVTSPVNRPNFPPRNDLLESGAEAVEC